MQDAGYLRVPVTKADGTIRCWTLVDHADAPLVERYAWLLDSEGYLRRNRWIKGGKGKTESVLLHREVLGLALGDKRHADHINRDRLDNRRENLRIVAANQNRQNVGSAKNASSRYRGVSWHKRLGRWGANCGVAGKTHHLGYFDSEEDAAMAAAAFRAQHLPFAED